MGLVPEAEAFAEAGPSPQVFRLPEVTFVLGERRLVIVVAGGDRPGGTAVQGNGELTVVTPFPGPVADALGWRRGGDAPAITGFARVDGGLVPLGPLRLTVLGGGPDGGVAEARLWLEESLSWAALDLVRPVGSAPLAGTGWLGLLPGDPVGALREFIAGWYADVPPGTPDVPDGSVPAPLRELYRAAAGRGEVRGIQNTIRRPDRLVTADGWTTFADENQGCFRLRYRADGSPDPAVECDERREAEALSGVLLNFVLFEASFTGPVGAYGMFTGEESARVTAGLSRVPLGPSGWMGGPASVYAGPGLVVAAGGEDDEWLVTVGARHRAALLPLRDVDVPWQSFGG